MTTKTLPEVRKAARVVDLTKQRVWLSQHKHEYVNQWVMLDGDRLIGHGPDLRPLFAQARAEGVQSPFVHFIRDESLPVMGGWV